MTPELSLAGYTPEDLLLRHSFYVKTAQEFDALASDFSDCFTTTPDFRPYKARPVDARIFDPEKAKDPTDPDYGRARLRPSFPLDDPDEMEAVLQRGAAEVKPRGR